MTDTDQLLRRLRAYARTDFGSTTPVDADEAAAGRHIPARVPGHRRSLALVAAGMVAILGVAGLALSSLDGDDSSTVAVTSATTEPSREEPVFTVTPSQVATPTSEHPLAVTFNNTSTEFATFSGYLSVSVRNDGEWSFEGYVRAVGGRQEFIPAEDSEVLNLIGVRLPPGASVEEEITLPDLAPGEYRLGGTMTIGGRSSAIEAVVTVT